MLKEKNFPGTALLFTAFCCLCFGAIFTSIQLLIAGLLSALAFTFCYLWYVNKYNKLVIENERAEIIKEKEKYRQWCNENETAFLSFFEKQNLMAEKMKYQQNKEKYLQELCFKTGKDFYNMNDAEKELCIKKI